MKISLESHTFLSLRTEGKIGKVEDLYLDDDSWFYQRIFLAVN